MRHSMGFELQTPFSTNGLSNRPISHFNVFAFFWFNIMHKKNNKFIIIINK